VRKLLLLAAGLAGAAALARKRSSGQAASSLWREATKDGAAASPRP
jgi:hypothetical protein